MELFSAYEICLRSFSPTLPHSRSSQHYNTYEEVKDVQPLIILEPNSRINEITKNWWHNYRAYNEGLPEDRHQLVFLNILVEYNR